MDMSRHHQMRVKQRRRWQRVRLTALNRDAWRCTACNRRGRLEVHHVVPLHQGGDGYDLDNLASHCAAAVTSLSRQRTTGAS